MDSESSAHSKYNCKYHIVFGDLSRSLILDFQGFE